MKTAVLFSFGDEDNQKFHETDNPDFLSKQVIMYAGRKLSILNFIEDKISEVKKRLGKNKITALDGFSGTGIVSRLLKKHCSTLYSNDLEYYSMVINQCYLTNKSSVKISELRESVALLNEMRLQPHESGFIEELYSPKITHQIRVGERAFFTNENAKIIDNIRRDIDKVAAPQHHSLLIAPLLATLKDKSNVQNVFRAFYKDTTSNKGQWGGNNPKTIGKLFRDIILEIPVLSDFNCESVISCRDTNKLVHELTELDLAYFDPPFDIYAYGEDYFMYNLVAKYERPTEITGVAGVPINWNRSAYNSKTKAARAIADLMENTKAKYVLFSYSENGILTIPVLTELLSQFGKVEVSTYQRTNLEYLFLIEMI
ncbi:MAG: DNA adenine methylase [Candidatus Kapabacteria bacterium]|nr:DNA adenine methylase [Candidatus Kapabacteria bacterium]